jgi:hypothetical protein
VDRDMLMRFHYGLGVGHTYNHGQQSVSPDQESHPQGEDENIPDASDADEEQNTPSTSGEHLRAQSSTSSHDSRDDNTDSWDGDSEDDDADASDDEEFYGLEDMYGGAL